ncbi:MAG TPA: abortive infection family protein [Candidatus Methanoperedens sp.]
MDRLKEIIEQHSRWQPFAAEYITRIEGYKESNFPLCVENAKSLLESIAKEICKQKSQTCSSKDSTGKILKLAFSSLGYNESPTIQQIGGAIVTIGHQMSTLRNEIGSTSHGKTLEELEKRKDVIDKASSDFLLSSTELVCCFLIQLFETDNPRKLEEKDVIRFDDNTEFNDYWNELFGEFKMAHYSYTASEILYNLDPKAYETELVTYDESKPPAVDETPYLANLTIALERAFNLSVNLAYPTKSTIGTLLTKAASQSWNLARVVSQKDANAIGSKLKEELAFELDAENKPEAPAGTNAEKKKKVP